VVGSAAKSSVVSLGGLVSFFLRRVSFGTLRRPSTAIIWVTSAGCSLNFCGSRACVRACVRLFAARSRARERNLIQIGGARRLSCFLWRDGRGGIIPDRGATWEWYPGPLLR